VISIIVYGRNDQHGYNLHKRAAISLNCLSDLLHDPDDELIFVDYNSSDHLPTFPEAIADTLAPEARARLRILRARPHIHRRFAAATPLAVIEPLARNIGVRRSNPSNRWILSTNTDVILLPRTEAGLDEIARAWDGGFYHTARFEIPESLWESFERTNPASILAETRRLGRVAHLNDVVHSSELVLYDGPGDCQFVQREDLFAMDGFDERMVLGWHVDSNLAKRLTLRCGPVSSLIDDLFCYHCNHMRVATAVHAARHIANDYCTFVEDVVQPDLPEQRETWGRADEELEEIRLASGTGIVVRTAIEATIPPLDSDFTQQSCEPATYDLQTYDPRHVVPFLADLLGSLPTETSLAFCGARCDTFDLLVRLWRHLGFRRPILVDRAASRYLGVESDSEVEIVDRVAWLARADLFAFEFGRASDGRKDGPIDRVPIVEDDDALSIVQALFLAAVADERSRMSSCSPPELRRFIGINCIHNRSESLFAAYIASPLTTFGSHLRHGFLEAAMPEVQPEIAMRCAIGNALCRAAPITVRELAFARELFQPLLDGAGIPSEREHSAAANAALGLAYVQVVGNPRSTAPPPEIAERAAAVLRGLRASELTITELGFPVVDSPAAPGERSLSRFATWEDWDDPAWGSFAAEIAPDSNLGHRRGAAVWEQVHLLYGLHRCGALGDTARTLVIATLPDPVIAALSRRLGRVDVFEAARATPADAASLRGFWSHEAPYDPQSLNMLAAGTRLDQFDAEAYDAVLFPHGSMFIGGVDGAFAWLRAAEGLLRPNGVLAFKSEIAAGLADHPNFFDGGFVADDGFASELEAWTPFEVEGGFDRVVSRATLDRVAPQDGIFGAEGYFLTRVDGRVLIPGLWFLRKRQFAGSECWDQLRHWRIARRFGEQLGKLLIGPAGMRDANGDIVTRREARGHVFFGPYIRAFAGRYRVLASVTAESAWRVRRISGVVLEAVVAGATVASGTLRGGVTRVDFEIAAALAASEPLIELRAFSPGGVNIRFTSIDLELVEPSYASTWPSLPVSGVNGPDSGVAAASETDAGMGAIGMTADRSTQLRRTIAASGSDEIIGFPPFEGSGPASARSLSRFASVDDWEDPAWSRFLDADPSSASKRDSGVWERAHLLYALDRVGKLTRSARVLVAATLPDALIARLSELVGRVEVFDLSGKRAPRIASEARLFWSNGTAYARDRLLVHDGIGGANDSGAFDAVVLPHGALLRYGVLGMARILAEARRLVARDGVVAFKADVFVGREPSQAQLDAGLIDGDGLVERLERDLGLVVEGGFDASLSCGTVPSRGAWDGSTESGGLVTLRDGRASVPSWWVIRKLADPIDNGWRRLETWLGERLLGDQLPNLKLGPMGARDPQGNIVTRGGGKGWVFYGPYIALPEGRYEASIKVAAAGPACKLMLDLVTDGVCLDRRTLRLAAGQAEAVRFVFAAPGPLPLERIEFRARSGGGAAIVTACRLQSLRP
jgi:hypothetical protein